jgi:prepilin-type N-terminal cleavage/methylation domain-containing protein
MYFFERKHGAGLWHGGFSLPEMMAALTIIALACSSVIVVVNQNVSTAARLVVRIRAFEVARNNMEKLLSSDAVKEGSDFGVSEQYPDIGWQTSAEAFPDPLDSMSMWARAVSSAEYVDEDGQTQKVELVEWITKLSDKQMDVLRQRKEAEEQRMDEEGQIFKTIEGAAEYIGENVETIRQWETNGMRKTSQGYYIIKELELYQRTNGHPTIQDRLDDQPVDSNQAMPLVPASFPNDTGAEAGTDLVNP